MAPDEVPTCKDGKQASEGPRLPWYRGARGEWYVIAQFALFALIVFGPPTVPGWP